MKKIPKYLQTVFCALTLIFFGLHHWNLHHRCTPKQSHCQYLNNPQQGFTLTLLVLKQFSCVSWLLKYSEVLGYLRGTNARVHEAKVEHSSCKVAVRVGALPFQLWSSLAAVNSVLAFPLCQPSWKLILLQLLMSSQQSTGLSPSVYVMCTSLMFR